MLVENDKILRKILKFVKRLAIAFLNVYAQLAKKFVLFASMKTFIKRWKMVFVSS